MDLGGGTGSFLTAVLSRHPRLGSTDDGDAVPDSPEGSMDPIDALRTNVGQFVQCVETLPDDLWLAKIVNWTPRDVVAHLIGWGVYMLEGCELMRVGKTPAYLNDREHDYRHVNAASVERYAARNRDTPRRPAGYHPGQHTDPGTGL